MMRWGRLLLLLLLLLLLPLYFSSSPLSFSSASSPFSDLPMSADNDLIIPDFSHVLPELEYFTRDLLLGNGIGISVEEGFGVEFEGKGGAVVVGLSDFTSLSSLVGDQKNTKALNPSYGTAFSEPVGSRTLETLAMPTARHGLLDKEEEDDLEKGLNAAICPEQIGLPSPTENFATRKLKCMSLNEVGSGDAFLPSLYKPVISDEGFPFPPSVSTARSLMLNGNISTSTAMQSGSATSSPTCSSSDGASAGGASPSLLAANDVVNGVVSEDENMRTSQRSSFSKLSACSVGLEDSTGTCPKLAPRIQFRNEHAAILPHVVEEMAQFPSMQRSQSSHALGQLRSRHGSNKESRISGLSGPDPYILEQSNLCPYKLPLMAHINTIASTKSMRRVYSAGDLQGVNNLQAGYGSSPLSLEQFSKEEGGTRIGHYTLEERKMRLHRYRQKRMERNFNKKIKYACRKTLADSRPRIRGRFARTDEVGEAVVKGNEISNDEDDEVVLSNPVFYRVHSSFSDYIDVILQCMQRQDDFLMPWNLVGNFWETLPGAF